MTTPTWEPVGQEYLELCALGPDEPGPLDKLVSQLAAELLAAHALLVALVEAETAARRAQQVTDHAERLMMEARSDEWAQRKRELNASWDILTPAKYQQRMAMDAIRAHVQRLNLATARHGPGEATEIGGGECS